MLISKSAADSESEQRQLDDPRFGFGRQAVIGKRQHPGAKRIANERHLGRAPTRCISIDDAAEITSDLVRRLVAPEIAQTIPADDRHAFRLQLSSDRAIEIAPPAVAGKYDGQQLARR